MTNHENILSTCINELEAQGMPIKPILKTIMKDFVGANLAIYGISPCGERVQFDAKIRQLVYEFLHGMLTIQVEAAKVALANHDGDLIIVQKNLEQSELSLQFIVATRGDET